MKIIARMFSRRRITLPREVRRELGVGPGDPVFFKTIGTEVYIYAAKKPRVRLRLCRQSAIRCVSAAPKQK